MVEQLCRTFNPPISKGAKLYFLVFASQDSSESMVIYVTFDGSEWKQQEVSEEVRAQALKYASHNLIVEE